MITQSNLKSGSGIQVYRTALILSKSGHDVTVLYGYDKKFDNYFKVFENTNINVIRKPLDRLKIDFKTIKSIFLVREILKKEKYDLIYAFKGTALDFLILASFGINLKIIARRGMMNSLNFFNSRKYKMKKVKKIITITNAVKEVIEKTGNINPLKIEIVLTTINTKEFNKKKSTIRKELKISEKDKIISFVGNESKIKGAKNLITVFEKLSEKFVDLKLIMVGISENYLNNIEINPKIKNKIFPLGFRDDVSNVLNGSDLYVYSGTGEEALGTVIAEAQSCCLPVIITKSGGAVELIKNYETGIIVEKNNNEMLIESIGYMFNNPKKAKEMGEKARAFVVKNMSSEAYLEKLNKLHHELDFSQDNNIKFKD